ncbi:hypothetical protein AAG587_20945 [Vreelandella neptunia]|uniref:hypothetical protein n=1 Tax=Vreelandella neptunia TaxID=115551 RepID=UPI00315A7BC9
MTPDDHQYVIDKLQELIDDTYETLNRFEEAGMDLATTKDYENLLSILDSAVKQQRKHTQAMLRPTQST